MVTEKPFAAAVPASPMNMGAPILLAYIDAPICKHRTFNNNQSREVILIFYYIN